MGPVKQNITAKLKLDLSILDHMQLITDYTLTTRDAINYVLAHNFENGRFQNVSKLHNEVYPYLRNNFGMPSQGACSAIREVADIFKTLWTKQKKAAASKKAGRKARRFKGLDEPIQFQKRTVTYSYGRDYSFKENQTVSIMTLAGRIVVPYEGYDKHLALIEKASKEEDSDVKIGAARIWYDKRKKQYYLLVSLEITYKEEHRPEDYAGAVGVDVGQRYIATAADSSGKALFFSGKEIKHKKSYYAKKRRELQHKGTRSAKRRLKAMSLRERRLVADVNHGISKRILERFKGKLVGIENLKYIRDKTNRRSSSKASKKQKDANRRQSQWSFAEFQAFLKYKAPEYGSYVVEVDPEYTSQQCIECGHTSRANRQDAGLLFHCVECSYKLHADLLGGRNICLRTLLAQQDWANTGHLSDVLLDASDVEAKAARLKRHAELRWSSDASFRCTS